MLRLMLAAAAVIKVLDQQQLVAAAELMLGALALRSAAVRSSIGQLEWEELAARRLLVILVFSVG
jgi:hypothetical protein